MPDEVFDHAEHLAKRLKVSRSELYSRAVKEYVDRHGADKVTESLDAVCDVVDTRSDRFVTGAARRILGGDEW